MTADALQVSFFFLFTQIMIYWHYFFLDLWINVLRVCFCYQEEGKGIEYYCIRNFGKCFTDIKLFSQ